MSLTRLNLQKADNQGLFNNDLICLEANLKCKSIGGDFGANAGAKGEVLGTEIARAQACADLHGASASASVGIKESLPWKKLRNLSDIDSSARKLLQRLDKYNPIQILCGFLGQESLRLEDLYASLLDSVCNSAAGVNFHTLLSRIDLENDTLSLYYQIKMSVAAEAGAACTIGQTLEIKYPEESERKYYFDVSSAGFTVLGGVSAAFGLQLLHQSGFDGKEQADYLTASLSSSPFNMSFSVVVAFDGLGRSEGLIEVLKRM